MRQVKNKKGGLKPNTKSQIDKSAENETNAKAYQQAEKDIEKDAELSKHSPNDDLDEGELARLGEGS